ncbi:helix-turn-helix transcriptional regulator [Paenibacillus sp. N3/727]|uniref:helix-turn-helix domain-containing protein n=1 Tax=Paenibacillus sp. N3/727 TaxID=2925845 RepID=UPI001F532B0B|nr:helix-turn-helix transcriptional regulator [Paenibacillus sp. N3/727]UNK19474.1 helix-turn-helix transcriptional regulator [Paenibacillus sp. N3/727]
MIHTTTIRSELESYLHRTGLTINQFAEKSKVNSGTISTIIKGTRPIAMQQLDRIVLSMGLPEGSFYELYVDECFVQSPNWRRLRPFLYRCAELDKLECIQRVVHLMMDNLSYIPALFDTAEDFFNQGKLGAAAIIYESITENEKYQHSERLALCHYRLFTISLGHDQEQNLRAATRFEGFVERLDVIDQLDALKDLLNMYFSLRQWDKVDEMAAMMGRKALIQYNYKYEMARRSDQHREPKHPLFLYIVYSHLMRAAVCDEHGDYEQALKYVTLYSDMSWVREDTEEAQQLIEKFKMWATANTYLYHLMMGKIEVLQEYVAFIESQENEIIHAVTRILQSANRFDFNIDDILQKFELQITMYIDKKTKTRAITHQVEADRYTFILTELASYYLSKEKYEDGIKCVLIGLESAIEIHNDDAILKYVRLFELFRHAASKEAQHRYHILISEVQKK